MLLAINPCCLCYMERLSKSSSHGSTYSNSLEQSSSPSKQALRMTVSLTEPKEVADFCSVALYLFFFLDTGEFMDVQCWWCDSMVIVLFLFFLQHFSYYLYYSPHAILLFITAHCMFITASPAPLALLYSPVSSTVWGHKTGRRLCSFRCYSNPLNVPLKTWHSLLKTIFQKWSGKPGKSLTSGPPPQTTLL